MPSFDPLLPPEDRQAALAAGFRPLVFGAPSVPTAAHFIPSEQVHQAVPWRPLNFDEPAPGAALSPALPLGTISADELAAEVESARQVAHEQGMRAGLAALDAYKRNHAEAMAAQMETVCSALQQRLDALEQTLADRVVDVALALARQVTRAEIQQRPELVASVAREALDTLMASARQIVLRVHPDDQALVTAELQERLTTQDIRLLADAGLAPGDCQVESDIGSVDAGVATRWRRAAASMGRDSDWPAQDAAPAQEDAA